MRLENRVVVITGGTKGLGLALAKLFIAKKSKVIVVSRSLDSDVFIEKSNPLYIKADVTIENDVKKIVKTAIKRFGCVDVWINNAGIWTPHAPIEKMNMKKIHEMIETNLFGTIYGSKHALIGMRNQKSGVIVNIISSSALDGSAGSSGYCASKFAASGFTKSLRLEVCKDNINIVAVYTRGIKTNLFDKKRPKKYDDFMAPHYVAEKIVKNLERNNPLEDLLIMH
ncbi:MAG: hypothetical protein UR60_C0002G0014 [Candidatus Moranbacteria bacterium GW2011_GWF2_34_56]|nr:MAG: hypothetical protein UR51_C0009G0063 [Candidatus Moranbacteria bacterium GW2011_GWF1_34_10]KKP65362.1 MAG: hypothetical protein UR60_C0002G0014 [Candidatus Moranbacteria bacterium GW2011_GWF2_34_56]HBI17447.1 hypothetical protein [Candidatus Moranbacteria bacterium]